MIGSVLQSLASIATVAAVVVAANQFLAGEKLVRERQSGLASAAADICSASAGIMSGVAKMGSEDGIMPSLAGIQRANEAQLNDLPLAEMPSATAMQALSGCRHGANWYSSLTDAHQGNRMANRTAVTSHKNLSRTSHNRSRGQSRLRQRQGQR
ncbi:hypothetical protein ACFPIF_11600 [Brevundimonas faecalis]|uniref:hypothetical protein n=1 Tax=Brevundimonas faecalis TaxID=947378 RepID=UPI00360D698C